MLKRYFVTCCVTRMLRYSLSYISCHSRRYIFYSSRDHNTKDRVVYQWLYSSESSKIKVWNSQLFCRSVIPYFNVVKSIITIGIMVIRQELTVTIFYPSSAGTKKTIKLLVIRNNGRKLFVVQFPGGYPTPRQNRNEGLFKFAFTRDARIRFICTRVKTLSAWSKEAVKILPMGVSTVESVLIRPRLF